MGKAKGKGVTCSEGATIYALAAKVLKAAPQLEGAAPEMKKRGGKEHFRSQNREAAKDFVEAASPGLSGSDKEKVTDSASLLTFRFECRDLSRELTD